MSEPPGAAVAVIARAPAQPAPRTMPTADSSSSAWTTAYVAFPSGPIRYFLRYVMRVSTSDDDGVIGYHVTTVTPANIAPIAPAAFPSTIISPRAAPIRRVRK